MKFFFAKLFSTFFFVGMIKKAPGTFGTLAGILVIWSIFDSTHILNFNQIFISVFLLGVISTSYYMQITKKMDPKEVVIDEVLGIWLCVFLNNYFAPNLSKEIILLSSFILFRFFDILKPYPISLIDKKMKNAFGVMFDDVVAAIFGSAVFFIFAKILL